MSPDRVLKSETHKLTAFEVLERYVDAKIRLDREQQELGEGNHASFGIELAWKELAEAEAHLKALFEGRGLIVTKRQIVRVNDEDLT